MTCFMGVRAQILEYWFDDNFKDKRASIPISVGTESMQVLELDLTDIGPDGELIFEHDTAAPTRFYRLKVSE